MSNVYMYTIGCKLVGGFQEVVPEEVGNRQDVQVHIVVQHLLYKTVGA